MLKNLWSSEELQIHHETFADLHRSASVGCQCCKILLERLKDALLDIQAPEEFLRRLILGHDDSSPICCTGFSFYETEINVNYTKEWRQWLTASTGAVVDKHPPPAFALISLSNSQTTDEADFEPSEWRSSAPEELHRLPIGTSTDSRETFELIRMWLQNCTQHHARCRARHKDEWLPSRLLDLNNLKASAEVRIYTTSSEDFANIQEYATLSHRWPVDSTAQLKLLQGNVGRLQKGFHESELSNAFRDAAQICIQLGIRYLWIDSLCIQQDNKADWAKEAALMAKVYKNGTINISATAGADGGNGCFSTRECSIQPLHTVKPSQNGTAGGLHLVVPWNLWRHNVEDASIQKRGWILQERVLSPRILHYTSEQVFWECQQLHACESIPFGLWGRVYYARTIEDDTFERKDFVPGRALKEHGVRREHVQNKIWKWMVESYSNCDLTFESDKLIAMSGIASEMHTIMQSQYLAGIWQSQLPFSLLWHHGGKLFKRTKGVAPSWSWASTRGPLYYPQHNTSGTTKGGTDNGLCEVIEANINLLDGSNPYGQVQNGSLTIRGRLGMIQWESDQSELHLYDIAVKITNDVMDSSGRSLVTFLKEYYFDSQSGMSSFNIHSDSTCYSREGIPGVHLDDLDFDYQERPKYILPVVSANEYVTGLLLGAQEDSTFVRIGTFQIKYFLHVHYDLPEVEITLT